MELYAEIILDHYQNPHHFGTLSHATFCAEDANPLCGDKLKMDFVIDKNDKISDVAFSGEGCAISRASASMLTDELIGKSLEEAGKITSENIFEMIQVPLTPARVKCALLGLAVLKKALLEQKLKINN
ncbi:MAG: SUF system NifU family Fe-S cluster assembly protein [Candidatus Gracilibacteria bacterium]|jgi:nitrogen fixation NifU-like protein